MPYDLVFLITPFIALFIAWFIWKKTGEREFIPGPKSFGASEMGLKAFYGWIPVILAVHIAAALLINGINGKLFFSDISLPGTWANWIGLAEIFIALSFLYGGLVRPSAVLLGFLWFYGLDLVGTIPMLKAIQYLGFAAFFYLAGRGPYAVDRYLFPILEPKESYTQYALLFLRIGIGLSFVVWAFTEKFTNPSLAKSLVEQHPFLNFTNINTDLFVSIAGALELFGGLLITFGIFPRFTALIALICINASLTISNWHTFVDYLPMYAGLATLLIWEPQDYRQRLLWVEGLRKGMDAN